MNGFTLYETLRILIPGALGVGVVALVLRLASQPESAQDPLAPALDLLGEAGVFIFAALCTGFLLYLLDLPTRMRIYSGDPDLGHSLPTTVLSELSTAARVRGVNTFSLYFLLSDAHLPAEAHRRVYFFGGTFRIFADARFLTMSGAVLGPSVALLLDQGPAAWHRPFDPERAFALLPLIAVILCAGSLAELKHAQASIRRRSTEGERPQHRYRRRLARAVERVLRYATILCGIGFSGALLASTNTWPMQVLGLVLTVGALVLWGMAELGPPAPRPPVGELRSRTLCFLRLPPWTRSQYTPAQRILLDLAVLAPALSAAAISSGAQGRPAVGVLLWGLLSVPATTIAAVRKHEVRLLNTYSDQVNWLRLNSDKITRILRRKQFEDDAWS